MDPKRITFHAKQSVKKAQAMMGDGWNHVSKDIQWGLVATHILGLILAQDEGNDPRRVLEMAAAVELEARKIIYPGEFA